MPIYYRQYSGEGVEAVHGRWRAGMKQLAQQMKESVYGK
jgi:hypothetical protein